MGKKVLLMILDGWGIAQNKAVSAIDQAQTPFIDSLYAKYPNSKLNASGLAVGLPEGQMGNSEVGHMNLGAGRIVYQDLVRVNKSIEDGSLANNFIIKQAVEYAKINAKPVHLIGLVSDGGIHSHIDHLKGIITIINDQGLSNLFVHAFTDGRDTDPKSGTKYIRNLQEFLTGRGQLASIIGRYYAMDRDNRWERIKLAYDLLVSGLGKNTGMPVDTLEAYYSEGITDEFMQPICCLDEENQPVANIQPGDVVLCFNFRTDRGRQITTALTQKNFPEYGMSKLDLHYLTLTNYDDTFKSINVLMRKDDLKQTIGEVLALNKKTQLRIAETEKYPHVTYFFSGGRELEFDLEKRILCPSPKVATYDLKPEMSAFEVRDAMIDELKTNQPDFVCLNFANPDMVGHTGVFEAAVKACETVDICASDVVSIALSLDYSIIIIADHGNSDFLINPDGTPNTAHTTNPVPCILVEQNSKWKIKDGILGNIAPTILKLMGIEKPPEMTCEALIYE